MAVTVPDLVRRAATRFSSSVAVQDPVHSMTFEQVGSRARRLANALTELGAGDRACVGVLLGNRIEYLEIDLAIALAGQVKVPVNPRLSDPERRYVLGNAGARVLLADEDTLDSVMDARDELPALEAVITLGDGAGATARPGVRDYETVLSAASDRWPSVQVPPGAPSVVLHTSGTTGHPKGATWTDRSRRAALRNMITDEYAMGPGDGMIHVAPLAHGSGSKLLAYFVRGARNIVLPSFDPTTFFNAVERLDGTSTFAVPTMIRMLLDAAADAGRDPDVTSLRHVTYGGAPIPTATLDEALERFGDIFVQVYGSCEAPHPVTVLPRDLHRPIDGSREHLTSAGREAMSIEVRVLDEAGGEVATGDLGELVVRGPSVMSGYWEAPAATAEAIIDGWYHTGDIGRRDERGFVYIVDRKRDMIISGGLNVYPAEVERVLQLHPEVRESCVLGVPDDFWGETVAAVIVTDADGGAELTESIIDHCRRHLAGYKKPRHVRFVPTLPKGPTGKVLREELRSMAWD